MDLVAEVIKAWERMEAERGLFLLLYQDVANYMLPDRNDFIVERPVGSKRMSLIYDGTAVQANQDCANGLHAMLTSPDLQWLDLEAEDESLMARDDVRAWVQAATKAVFAVYSGESYGFATHSHVLYQDLAAFGTGVMSQLHGRDGIQFQTHHLKECNVAENDRGRIDVLCRKWSWTADQAYDMWGAAAGPEVCKAMADAPNRKFEFLHLVRPRRERDTQRADARNKAFQSVYVNLTEKLLIGEGGFDEFPYHVPRFNKVTGETLGRGPGIYALPDVKMLNKLMEIVVKSGQKMLDPALQIPDAGYELPIKSTPGARIYYRAGSKDRIEPLQTGAQFEVGQWMVQYLTAKIRAFFFADLLRMPQDPSDPASSGKGITATYVDRDTNDRMGQLSPIVARMRAEFLAPAIERTLAILWRQSRMLRFGPGSPLPPPPAALSGARLGVKYSSPLAIAQRAPEMTATAKVLAAAGQLAQFDPSVPMIVDAEQALRLIARDVNAPAIIIRPAAQVAAMRAKEQQQQEAMANQQAMLAAAKGGKDAAGAVSALSQAAQPAGGAGAGAAGGGQQGAALPRAA
jgi:hypothetical protein